MKHLDTMQNCNLCEIYSYRINFEQLWNAYNSKVGIDTAKLLLSHICFHRSDEMIFCKRSLIRWHIISPMSNRSFSYSQKESESNDVLMHFEKFSNVHSSDRSSSATRSASCIKMHENNARPRLFCRIAKSSIRVFYQY